MVIRFKKYSATEFDRNVKATIQRSGKLGFSEGAIKKLDLANKKGVTIGRNEGDVSDTNLYMVLESDENDDSFRLNKAGLYYYANTKPLFDSLNLDYLSKTIIFDITPTEFSDEGKTIYRLVKREIMRDKNAKQKEEDQEED